MATMLVWLAMGAEYARQYIGPPLNQWPPIIYVGPPLQLAPSPPAPPPPPP